MSEEEGADSVGSFKIRLLSDGATIAEERYRSHFLTFAHAVWMPDRNAVVLGYCSFGMPEIRVWRSSDGVRQESQAYRAALLRSLIASYGTARGFEDWPSGPEGKREYCSQEAEKKYKEIGGHSPLGPGAVEEVGIVASSP